MERAPSLVLVLDPACSARRRRGARMDPRPGLDARLLVGAHDVLVGPELLALPAAAIQVEHEPGLALEVRVAREDPAAVRPRPQGVLAQPAPDGRDTDRLDEAPGDRDPGDLRAGQARERQPEVGRQLTGERLDLDDHPRGKRSAAGRTAGDQEAPRCDRRKTACASGSRSCAPSRAARRSRHCAGRRRRGPRSGPERPRVWWPSGGALGAPARPLLGRQLDPVRAPSRHGFLLLGGIVAASVTSRNL